MRAYAESRGWPRLTSEQYIVASKPGEGLSEVIALVVQSVAALSDRPSEQEKIVRHCLGEGIKLHTLELGPLETYLPGMMMVWSAAESVERELDTALADLAQAEERHREDLKNFEDSLYSRIMSEGVHVRIGGHTNGNGHATPEGLGEQIRSARAKRNISQRKLAELANLSGHTAIQRLEETGKGEGLDAVLKVLGIEPDTGSLAPERV